MTDRPSKATIRPAIRPSEQWRAALKREVLAAATDSNGPSVRADAGTRDITDQPLDHVHTVTDPILGVTVTACDLEPLTDVQVLRVARLVAALRETQRQATSER